MKILYVTTIGTTMGFFTSLIRQLLALGHSVDIACNTAAAPLPDIFTSMGCKVHPIACSRSPWSAGNWAAVRQLRALTQENRYDLVHCHTPVAAACTRIACAPARKQGTQVFYTAHGFHFYRGAPLKNWLLYFPAEWLFAWMTDVLITINQEDHALARRWLQAKRTEFVPGVGIDTRLFSAPETDRAALRAALGIPEDALLLLSVGELSKRKDHATALRALARLADPGIYYVIAGDGPRREPLRRLSRKLGIDSRVRFLGLRRDVAALCRCADIFLHPSRQEGLPVAVMEAMAARLPCILSRIRGNTDLLDASGAAFFPPGDRAACADAIRSLMGQDLAEMGRRNAQKALALDSSRINTQVLSLYRAACPATPKVSIVIPAYNAANYLGQAIDSALAQTYTNFEVIVVNDGSRDGGATAAVAARYAGRIRYIEKENGGSSSALNRGILAMSGEWFSWLSHDDLYYPDKLARQIRALNSLNLSPEAQKGHIFFSAADLIDGQGRILRRASRCKSRRTAARVARLEDNAALIAAPVQSNFHGCSCLIHKSALEAVGMFDESLRLVNDAQLWFRLYAAGFRVHYLPGALVAGRIHREQLSRQIGYSYHNPEQDRYWRGSLEYLQQHCPEDARLFLRFAIEASLKTRDAEADRAFFIVGRLRPRWRVPLGALRLVCRMYARLHSGAKALFLRLCRRSP